MGKIKWFLLALSFLLTGCAVEYANDLYKDGLYVDSVEALVDELNDPYSPPSKAVIDVINKDIAYAERKLAAMDVEDKDGWQYAYNNLMEVHWLLSNRTHSHYFASFLNKYNDPNSLPVYEKQTNDNYNPVVGNYRKKGSATYQRGTGQSESDDPPLFQEQRMEEHGSFAVEAIYQRGLSEAEDGQYKQASQSFAKVIESYKGQGEYKDSDKLFAKYDKMWRTEGAEYYYQQAKKDAAKSGSRISKKRHREIAQMYCVAHEQYEPYGNYKDAKNLAALHKQKGQINVRFVVEGDTSSAGTIGSEVKKRLKSYFDTDEFTVNDRVPADVTIKIRYQANYRPHYGQEKVENMQTTEGGYVRNYKKIIRENQNNYTADIRISTTSLSLSFNDEQFQVSVKSSEKLIEYQGNLPTNFGYPSRREGVLESKYGLEKKLAEKVNGSLSRVLKKIKNKLEGDL